VLKDSKDFKGYKAIKDSKDFKVIRGGREF